MPIEHHVEQGESIGALAGRYGFRPETIWEDPANADLRQRRGSPNILHPGDVVVIPDRRPRQESVSTERRGRFKRHGHGSKLHLKLMEGDKPRADLDYVLEVDGQLFRGTTDGDGVLEQAVPPDARRAALTIGTEVIPLMLGHMDPASEVSGVQARLNNLGFACGEADGVVGDATREALRAFQGANGLNVTGEVDAATRAKLEELHGC